MGHKAQIQTLLLLVEEGKNNNANDNHKDDDDDDNISTLALTLKSSLTTLND